MIGLLVMAVGTVAVGCTAVESSVNYIATSMTDGECDMKRLYRGRSLCRTEPPPTARMARPSYCYRSIGTVECYETPQQNRTLISG